MGEKYRVIQSQFNRGEISPRLKGRVDNKAYYGGFSYSENIIPFPEGSCTFRPGTVYVSGVKTNSKVTIVRPFRFSTIQNYILEFGDQYVRFYRNRGRVEDPPGTPYEVATPYLEADLRELNFVQSADVLYILHNDYQPRTLIRTSDTSWSLSTISFTDGPYLPINSTATTITPSGTSGSVTLTASTSIFVAGDVGRQMRLRVSTGTWSWGTITAYSSGTSVTFTISGPTLSGTTATTSWRFGAFGGSRKWPAVGSIYEERLTLGRTIDLPSTVWGSVVGDFTNYGPSQLSDGVVRDDDGFAFTIGDDQVNAINWMSSGRTLMIGTTGGEYSMTGGTSSTYAPITPTNVTIKRETNYGAKPDIRAHRVGSAVLYTSQSGRKLRELYYEFGIDSYISRDISRFSEHILNSGIIDIDYAQEPDPHLWMALNDGQLIGLVYERNQEVEGFHRHIIGGSDVYVESVAVIPRPADLADDVWLVVRRTVNGSTVRYIEYISELYEDVSATLSNAPDRPYAKYLDSCLTYDGYLNATLTPGATTGTGVTFTAGSSVFAAGDVGKQIRSGSARATITGYTSGTVVTATITAAFASTSAIAAGNWCLAAKTFSGLTHLEGQTVGVQADGYITDDEVVSSGSITIDNFACVVHVGLKYNSKIRLLPTEIPGIPTIQGREKSVQRAHLYVTDTYGIEVGMTDVGITDIVKQLKFPLITDQAQPLKTGLLTIHPPSGYDRSAELEIEHNYAMPFTLNYVVQEIDVNL